ncbi:LytTR family DNA-binding domain-containing protein [Sulfuritalea sp.]|uniref:LytR/AlgR family response regulator transcription factor n=1 Tax=Sulfuritalea sp. TaxID=2480090 RepID=UPI001AD132AE|nr:LytTR family DNA-binding domain-containing protein [Sulfuritalea sp.]MBN8474492.1 response regulator transcription factor [Sulfuritalea sp.]
MKAVIADDESLLAQHLRTRLATLWPELDIAGIAANGIEARDMIETLRPDLAFLDIRMPGLSGLEVIPALSPAARAACRVVFVTAYDEFAVQAFEREAVDYLLKPVADERLALAVERLRRRIVAAPQDDLLQRLQALLPKAASHLEWVRASVGNEVRLVAVDEVCYFQAADKYTAVFTRDAELLIRTPIKELAEQLDPEKFWQVHRGTLINARQVVSARHDALGRVSLKLRDRAETVAVSRGYAHLFRQM